jgi:hypothetical protein
MDTFKQANKTPAYLNPERTTLLLIYDAIGPTQPISTIKEGLGVLKKRITWYTPDICPCCREVDHVLEECPLRAVLEADISGSVGDSNKWDWVIGYWT